MRAELAVPGASTYRRNQTPLKSLINLKAALIVNYAAMVSLAIAVNLMPVFLTTLRVDLGGAHELSNEQLGRIGAASFLGLIAGITVASPLAGRTHTRTLPAAGNLLIMAGLAALGTAQSYTMVLMAVFLMGLGAGILDMILSPIVCVLQPERRTQAMNWLHSFYCLGAMFTVLGAALAGRMGLNWRMISLLLVSIPLTVLASFLRVALPPLSRGEKGGFSGRLMSNSLFLAALAAIFLGGAAELGLAQWLPAYAESGLGFTKWTGSMALFGFSFAMTAGRLVAGIFDRRWGPVTLLVRCCGISVLLFLAGSFAPWPNLALLACIAVGFTASCLWPTMLGVAADWFPEGGVVMFGMLAILGNFGGVFMPWVIGITADVSNIRIGLSTAALCPFLMMCLLWWMRRQRRAC